MHKTIEIRDDGPVAVTTNGGTTITALLYAQGLPETTPLPNGFDRELADWVVGVIEEREGHLWNQDVWRRRAYENEVNPELDIKADEKHPCGTSMCFAGWTTELAGGDHVYDTPAIKARTLNQYLMEFTAVDGTVHQVDLSSIENYGESVIVSHEDPATKDLVRAGYATALRDIPDETLAYLHARGFDDAKHVLVSVSDYAAHRLGILEYHRDEDGRAHWFRSDPFDLFDGENTWPRVKGIIDAYTEMESISAAYHLLSDGTWTKERARQAILCRGVDHFMANCSIDLDFNPMAIARECYAQGVGYDYHRLHADAWMLGAEDADEGRTRRLLELVDA